MSISHLNEVRSRLERRHWIVVSETNKLTPEEPLQWKISRPNGDTPLTVTFTPGLGGAYGQIPMEEIEDGISCQISEHPEIPYLYFGSKFHGRFQQDVAAFVDAVDSLDK